MQDYTPYHLKTYTQNTDWIPEFHRLQDTYATRLQCRETVFPDQHMPKPHARCRPKGSLLLSFLLNRWRLRLAY